MKHNYYIFKSGRLKRKDNTVFLETIDEERKYLPIESIDSLHLFGEIDLNTKLLVKSKIVCKLPRLQYSTLISQ